jgi:hypothetical protein
MSVWFIGNELEIGEERIISRFGGQYRKSGIILISQMKTEREQLKTPVILIIFNSPERTLKVFEKIREVRPVKLFVAADGPRPQRPEDKEKCDAAREIIQKIDWDCDLRTDFVDANIGCRRRTSSGISWAFSLVEQAIILDDDCVPDSSFFRFCEELLDQYKNDSRIMAISGNNFQLGKKRSEYSYYFSRFSHAWGWATWGRAWKYYDDKMSLWPYFRDNELLRDIFPKKKDRRVWDNYFKYVYKDKVDSWAFRWLFSCWTQNGLTILPNVNLVTNIGFESDATHTRNKNDKRALIPLESMSFPLRHPPFLIRDIEADEFTQKYAYTMSRLAMVKRAVADYLNMEV